MILLPLFLAPAGPIDLGAHGFRDGNFISFQAVGERLLVIGTLDHRLALLETDGSLVAEVAPGERDPAWNNPFLLGVTDTRILVAMGTREVRCFDHSLQPIACDYPSLPVGQTRGDALAEDELLLFTFGTETHAITHLKLAEEAWKVHRSLVPIPTRPAEQEGFPPMPERFASYQQGRVFVWDPLLPGETRYTIEVYAVGRVGPAEQVMALQQELPELEGKQGALTAASLLGKGYAVAALVIEPGSFAPAARTLDIFAADGSLQEHRKLDVGKDLKPLGGSDRALLLEIETLILHPLR